MRNLIERLKEESLQLVRRSFDSVDAVISANLCDETIDRIEALVEVLEDAREYISEEVEEGFRPATRLDEKMRAALKALTI
jgi:hypothetical protein